MGGDGEDERRATETADPLLAAVGARIREARVAAGLSVIEAGDRSGVHKGFFHRVESGQQNLNLRTLAKVAVGLDTTMSALLDTVEADQGTLTKRPYNWQAGKDVRPKTARAKDQR